MSPLRVRGTLLRSDEGRVFLLAFNLRIAVGPRLNAAGVFLPLKDQD